MMPTITVSTELLAWARLTLAIVMLVAGVGKLVDLDSFIQAAINYKILSRRATRLYARIAPWLEIAAAMLLVSTPLAYLGAILSGLLLVSFTLAVAVNVMRGRQVHCGCMGKLTTEQIGWPLLLRNVLLLGCVLLIGFGRPMPGGVPSAVWFPLSTLVVSAVIILTLFGSGVNFLRQAFVINVTSSELSASGRRD